MICMNAEMSCAISNLQPRGVLKVEVSKFVVIIQEPTRPAE